MLSRLRLKENSDLLLANEIKVGVLEIQIRESFSHIGMINMYRDKFPSLTARKAKQAPQTILLF